MKIACDHQETVLKQGIATEQGAEFPISVTGKKWQLRTVDSARVLLLCQSLGMSQNLARILVARGFNAQDVSLFLNPSLKKEMPDPSHLVDMDLSVARIAQEIIKGGKIALFGDYDVDGATSTALFASYLQDLGVAYTYHIPDRLQEGYGPNAAAFKRFKDVDGAGLAITLDCGTTAFEPLAAAHDMGLDVIVIDHHAAEPRHPQCYGLINPNRLDQEESCVRHLAAVGVTYLVLVALTRYLRTQGFFADKKVPDLLSYLDLVALGTVCDVVALTGLNRVFVAQGLKVLRRRERIGLRSLCDQSGLQQAPSCYHLGFVLGPRINAGGRVGEAPLGTQLLLTSSDQQARQIATRLSLFNEERKELEQQALLQAAEQAEAYLAKNPQAKCLVVSSSAWHPGVIGIVAGRLKDQYHLPTFVVSFDADGMGKGSGRSMPALDLGALIQAAKQSGILQGGGGHAMAGGITLTQDQLIPFQDFCQSRIERQNLDFTPILKIDDVLSLGGVSLDFVRDLEQLAPFGQANPGPKILLRGVQVLNVTLVGEVHMRCLLSAQGREKSLQAMAFRAKETALGNLLERQNSGFLDLVVSLKRDSWMDRERVSVTIEDAREHTPNANFS